MRQEEYVYLEKQVGPYHVKVIQDFDPVNPRTEWDNFGHMVCFHSRYSLGDKHDLTIDEVKEIADNDKYVVLPLFLYDHSGITMNTSGFSCPWDSGQVGIIYVSLDEVRKEYGVKKVSARLKEKVRQFLKNEVETYDQYLTGQVYAYVVEDSTGSVIDSCYGFYGDENYCLEEGVSIAESQIKKDISKHLKKLKAQIKSKTPLMYREPCPIKK
jgi:hypothetical protein